MGPTVASVVMMATAPVWMGCLPSLPHFSTPLQCSLRRFPEEALPLESLALLLGTHTMCTWECVCLCMCVCVLCVYTHAGMLSGLGGGGELLTS